MRVLGIGDCVDLGDMYLRLAAAGHSVKVFAEDPAYRRVLAGMIDRVADWREALPWIRGADGDAVIVFETAGHGAIQDELRAAGYPVVGGSAFGDRLEGERGFGQEVLRGIGLRTAATWRFDDLSQGIAFVRENPARYVFKPNGLHNPSPATYVGASEDGIDLISVMTSQRRMLRPGSCSDFVLMEHVAGIEIGVGAYFNGTEFITPANLDWEHKRFFTGDLGEMTGEMGTVVTYRAAGPLFTETLARLRPALADSGYHGYVNLNTIVNEKGIWPLELTCRFGYPGFAILDALHPSGWEPLLRAMLGRGEPSFPSEAGYAVGVVLTTPPFPHEPSRPDECADLPVTIRGGMDAIARRHLHLNEVCLGDQGWVTSGASGYVLVATGASLDVAAAQAAAYRLIERVSVPNGRYRTDIGNRFISDERERLEGWGYLPSSAR